MRIHAVLVGLVWAFGALASPGQGDGGQTRDIGRPAANAEDEAREIETYSMIVDQQIGQQRLRNAQERALGARLLQESVATEIEQGRLVQAQQERRAELEAARRLYRIQQQETRGRAPPAD